MLRLRLSLSLFLLLALNSCGTVQLPNTTSCAVAGVISGGSDCVEVITKKTSHIDYDATISFIEARPDHAAAIFMSAEDYGRMKKAGDEACRILGRLCTLEMKRELGIQ